MPNEDIQIPVDNLGETLEGRLRQVDGDAAATIAPPHPQFGGTIDNPVVSSLESGLNTAGVSTLAFNWEGVGQSTGTPNADPNRAIASYQGAISALRRLNLKPTIAAGYSFGAAAAIQAALQESDLQHLVLVAPPFGLWTPPGTLPDTLEVSILTGEHDDIAPASEIKPWAEGRQNCDLRILPGADHFFSSGGTEEIATIVADRIR